MLVNISKSGNIKYALSGDDQFVGSVSAGDSFTVECAININDGTIRHLGQQLAEADVVFPYVNGATGPIEIRGAKSGDMLVLEIQNIELDNLGFTALWPDTGMFTGWAGYHGLQTRVVEVKDGFVHWNEHIKLPVKPMIGVAGVAPVHGAVLTVDNGPHGGNLDVQEITTGNKVMFRVQKEGAHLFLGDCHAIQGDGECMGMGAIEIAAKLTVRATLLPAPSTLNHPRIETPSHYCTVGCARPLEDAMRIAFQEMIHWLEEDWGIPAIEAYMLLGQVAEARCTQVVNPKYTYICKIEKSILERYHGKQAQN
ncbi:acetamidase [Agrobacterium tumefaciens]|uniref:acetamidase/formamidase family protein n=1 Tax=Agrobacterium tumefaciens TaxID=358 RepID=UPI0015746BC0|nr:acetamidase/formamidase family protein [Agrobacterium tumefaciens]NTB97346.1 acetamidase [Agrobacterium tumefaciens]NTC45092.1 acetamidase [Agrobacterium tumefaciens]